MSTLTNDELQAIRARAEAATPGPWEKDGFDVYTGWSRDVYAEERGYKLCGSGFDEIRIAEINNCNDDVSDEECLANADFAAHARTDIPALLEHIEHLNRVYTMPCPYCDFSSGQRGMDRCPHCDGTGRMATHAFIAQQGDIARAELEHQKRALEWLADIADRRSVGTSAHKETAIQSLIYAAFNATKEAASE